MTLVLAAAVALGAPGHVASGYGLLFAAPPRWHARIYERSGGAPIIQVADARLGAIDEDDLAVSTQRRLRPGRILIVVLESRPVRALIARWRKTYPAVRLPIAVHRVAGPFEGQQAPAAAMRLFRTAGRFFQLMVFFGDRHPSRADFALANRALRGLRFVPQR